MSVGGTVLSGIKSLGEMAYSAAKVRVGPGYIADQGGHVRSSSSMSGLTNLFFSRSAPAASGSGHARRESLASHTLGTESSPHVTGNPRSPSEPGFTPALHSASPLKAAPVYHIKIVDLAPLLASPSSFPTVISKFMVSKRQPISNIEFTSDGNSLIVSTEDGKVIRVFQVRPVPSTLRGGHVSGSTESGAGGIVAEPWHLYNLRRGRTSAIVEGISVSEDGRWIAVGTRKRTVHVFAVNPYGGKPDTRSHLEERVQNVSELVSN
jgi:WD40 repeat protein